MSGFEFDPKSASFSPSAAYGFKTPFSGKIPKLSTTGFLPYPTVGLDTETGKRIDYQAIVKGQEYKGTYGQDLPALDPEWGQRVAAEVQLAKALQPVYLDRARAAAQLQADLSGEQIRQLYPLMSAAQAQSVGLNLGASKAFKAFKEQMPSAVQDIMASKQGQMYTAAAGEAERQRATAAQQQAAKDFAGRFAGQYIQVA
jgi:hypothetical protein